MIHILDFWGEKAVVVSCHRQVNDTGVLEWEVVGCFINVDLSLAALGGGLDDCGINELVGLDLLESVLPVQVVLSLLIAGTIQ